jgi:hemoglobin
VTNPAPTLYELAGGEAAIQAIVSTFYDKVANNPVLRPLFPDDFTEVRNKQYKFLTQFFGGPALYSMEYGAPMLKFRHMQIGAITPRHARAWLECMSQALQENGIRGPLYDVMMDRLTRTAYHMVNHTDDGKPLTAPRLVRVENRSDDEPEHGSE